MRDISVENDRREESRVSSHENSDKKDKEDESPRKHDDERRDSPSRTESVGKPSTSPLAGSHSFNPFSPTHPSHPPVVTPIYPTPHPLFLHPQIGLPGSVPNLGSMPSMFPMIPNSHTSGHHCSGLDSTHPLLSGHSGLLPPSSSSSATPSFGLYHDVSALSAAYANAAYTGAIFSGHPRLRFSPYALPSTNTTMVTTASPLATALPYDSSNSLLSSGSGLSSGSLISPVAAATSPSSSKSSTNSSSAPTSTASELQNIQRMVSTLEKDPK